MKRLKTLCADHYELSLKSCPERNCGPEEIRNDPAAQDRYCKGLMAVAWLFERKGVVLVPVANASEDAVMETALEAGAEDMQTDDTSYEIRTEPTGLDDVKKALDAASIAYDSAEVTMLPQTRVTLGEKEAQQVLRLMDALEDLDDVQQVYANFDIPDQIMEAVAA